MKNNFKFSVLLPVYDLEKPEYFNSCLNSTIFTNITEVRIMPTDTNKMTTAALEPFVGNAKISKVSGIAIRYEARVSLISKKKPKRIVDCKNHVNPVI